MLFAQLGGRGSDPLRSPEVIWGTAGLALALLSGAVLLYVADRWRKKSMNQATETSAELTEFRRMFERGEITEEEYVRLRERVAQRVKEVPTRSATQSGHPTATTPGLTLPTTLPGPDQPTPPPDTGKPANPSSSA